MEVTVDKTPTYRSVAVVNRISNPHSSPKRRIIFKRGDKLTMKKKVAILITIIIIVTTTFTGCYQGDGIDDEQNLYAPYTPYTRTQTQTPTPAPTPTPMPSPTPTC